MQSFFDKGLTINNYEVLPYSIVKQSHPPPDFVEPKAFAKKIKVLKKWINCNNLTKN